MGKRLTWTNDILARTDKRGMARVVHAAVALKSMIEGGELGRYLLATSTYTFWRLS